MVLGQSRELLSFGISRFDSWSGRIHLIYKSRTHLIIMELNKKLVLVAIATFLVVASAFLVVAAKDDANASDADKTAVKNMTYGQCVSEAANVKNDCYASVKEADKACKADAANQSDSRTALKNCQQVYKKDMAQCKADFKATKKTTCNKIKHNFFDTIRYSFK